MNYWQKRNIEAQQKISSLQLKKIEKLLRTYYGRTTQKILGEFEQVYNKILLTIEEGKEPTPADLYKLDKYWQMQGQLRKELEKLGERQVATMSKAFEVLFFDVYYAIEIPGLEENNFNVIDKALATQLINSVWVADGKAWSERIWENTNKLQQALNDNLIHCLVTGKKPTELKKLLQEDFNVSYNRADALVRTEIAHIQTQAAQKRYENYGLEQVEVWVDEDERTCPICAGHEGEKYGIHDTMPVPFHPRCRCCMVPVI
jgi:SPP1 gp7 family putative phage head morphogenesis protein